MQQPAQEIASQTQAPALQRWPAAQAELLPQRQLPVSQRSALAESQARQLPPAVPQLERDGG